MKPVRRRKRNNELDSVGLAGWLYTDLLLGLMVIFLGLATYISIEIFSIDEEDSSGSATSDGATSDSGISDKGISGFTITETDEETKVNENGKTDRFIVDLDIRPESNVVLEITTTDQDEVKVVTSSLIFTPDNWENSQEVILEGVDDLEIDGNQTSEVLVGVVVSSSDDSFAAVKNQTVIVETEDDDVPPPTTTLPPSVEKCYFLIDLTSVRSDQVLNEENIEDIEELKNEFERELDRLGIAGQSIGVLLTFADSPAGSGGSSRAQSFNEEVAPLVNGAGDAATRHFYTESLGGAWNGYRLNLYLLTGAEFQPHFDTTSDGQCDSAILDPEEEAILLGSYEWMDRGEDVDALLAVLGRPLGYFYGESTRLAHISELEMYGLSLEGVPSRPE